MAEFLIPRLYRLDAEKQRLVELFVLASGRLKDLVKLLGLSYPTVRSRLDRLIERLKEKQAEDEEREHGISMKFRPAASHRKDGMRMIETFRHDRTDGRRPHPAHARRGQAERRGGAAPARLAGRPA
jgi:hypothetical protein